MHRFCVVYTILWSKILDIFITGFVTVNRMLVSWFAIFLRIGPSLRSAKLGKRPSHVALPNIDFYLVISSSLLLKFYTPAFLQSACLLSADYSEELCSHRSTFHGLDLSCRLRHIGT